MKMSQQLKKEEEKSKEESLFLKGLHKLAETCLEEEDAMLIRWWCNKYNLPPNHPLLLNRYQEDLMVEALQDQILREKDKGKEEDESEESWEYDLTSEHDERIKKKLQTMSGNDSDKLSKWQERARLLEADSEDITEIEEIDEEF